LRHQVSVRPQHLFPRHRPAPGRGGRPAELRQAKRALGDEQGARRLSQEQLSLTAEGPARARGRALQALAAVSEPARRLSLLREAVDLLHTSGDRLAAAWAYADLSDALREVGDSTLARRIQRTAWYLAKQCQAQPLLRRLQPELGTPEAPPADGPLGADELSDAELRVAALAALGHTNREIARRLYVTVSTVEQHLTRVYRKLRVTRRADLPAGLSLTVSAAEDGSAIRA
jgi:DNA-binding CsgD family transcriptional regulator